MEGAEGAVGEGVGERAEADHNKELEAVVLEDEGEGGKARVGSCEALGPGGKEIPEEQEGEEGAGYVGGCDYGPARRVELAEKGVDGG